MQISHFDCEEVRQLILPTQFEGMFTRILTQTMSSKDCGPEIRVSRYGRCLYSIVCGTVVFTNSFFQYFMVLTNNSI